MRQSPFWSNVSPSLEGRCSVLSHPESRKWAQRAAKQPCHPFANCTGFGVLAFELHDTGPIVKTAMIFHQTPQSPHNLRQTSMYRHYDNTMPSHDYLKKNITLQLSHCALVVIVIIPSIPGTCHQPKNRWSSVTPEPPKAFAKPLEALIIASAARPLGPTVELWVRMCLPTHGDYRMASYSYLFILNMLSCVYTVYWCILYIHTDWYSWLWEGWDFDVGHSWEDISA